MFLIKGLINLGPNNIMRIGFAKLGLKTYFNESKSKCEGYNHELLDVFDMFEKRGHECVMLSVSDKHEIYRGTDLDCIFLFNGPLPKLESGRKYMLFKNYAFPIIDYINSNNIPYVYFWTDYRYDIRENKLIRKPSIILSQEKENYGHLEKLILYGKSKQELVEKDIKLGILMNETEPKRSKEVLKALNWLEYGEIRGKWKNSNKFLKESINENELNNYLSRVKYSYNLATNKKWVSQKYWEMILNNVVCFYKDYDEDKLCLSEHIDGLRVIDAIDLGEKIDKLENNEEEYKATIELQQNLLEEQYFNGDFMYRFILDKLFTLGK